MRAVGAKRGWGKAIEVDSREQVDKIVRLALENGGTRYRDKADHGWMYYDRFADLDGHQWEVMCMNANQNTMQDKITIQAVVSADKQKVWDYYTLPEHITKWNFADPSWHCPTASNELIVGGQYKARMEAKDGSFGFDFEAVYTELVPGDSFTYEFGGRFASVRLIEKGGATEISVVFDPETENPIEMQKSGWQAILDNFKNYTEGLPYL